MEVFFFFLNKNVVIVVIFKQNVVIVKAHVMNGFSDMLKFHKIRKLSPSAIRSSARVCIFTSLKLLSF